MKPLVIAVDVDEVVADLMTAWITQYNYEYRDTVKTSEITEWDMTKSVKPECGKRIYDILKYPWLYSMVDPIPGALEAVNLLRAAGHRVIFVSACGRHSMNSKVEWLMDHKFLPYEDKCPDFIACQDKYLIRADYLIDDRPLNVEKFPGTGVLIRQPHNRSFEWPGNEADSLLQAARMILRDQALIKGAPAFCEAVDRLFVVEA